MKKLEDIPKKNVFMVPDGYFEKLPGVIQARVAKPESKVWFAPTLKFAAPLAVFAIAAAIWFTSGSAISVEDQLSEIQTDQLMAYLEEDDFTTDLDSEHLNWSEQDLNELEEKVISSLEPINISIEDLSVEPENFE